jgi:hypothetical protein
MMNFDELMKRWEWRPIRNCPGRFILAGARPDLSPGELLGVEIEARVFKVEAARDTVIVVKIDGGGLISYNRADGSYLHTLNTPEGFERKLLQLGIDFNQIEQDL